MDGSSRHHEHGFVSDRRAKLVGIGDVLFVSALVLVGLSRHGTDPLAEPLAALEAVVPFVIAWPLIAALAGLYASDAITSPKRAARVTTVAWLAGANVGLILRSSPVVDGASPWPFNVIMTGMGLVVLVTWRVTYANWAS